MKALYRVYDAPNNKAVYEEIETGKLELVKNNCVISSAIPEHIGNYARINSIKGKLLTTIYADGNRRIDIDE